MYNDQGIAPLLNMDRWQQGQSGQHFPPSRLLRKELKDQTDQLDAFNQSDDKYTCQKQLKQYIAVYADTMFIEPMAKH